MPDGKDTSDHLLGDDKALLAHCDVHVYRSSGPGGQHRNKVSSAVRLLHRPTGVTGHGDESRSQQDNRRMALRRLRMNIACRIRRAVDPAAGVPHAMGGLWIPYKGGRDASVAEVSTAVAGDKLVDLSRRLLRIPEGFQANPKVLGILQPRAKKLEAGEGVDWGTGEALAFASLLDEGVPVRLSGQDARRGTFAHRHAVLFDGKTGQRHSPLQHLSLTQGRFEVWDSPLSETGVLGFDYGYSLD
ncbi:MAG: peptide chain release factor-like protein, partial [Planctomycetota bacterium]